MRKRKPKSLISESNKQLMLHAESANDLVQRSIYKEISKVAKSRDFKWVFIVIKKAAKNGDFSCLLKRSEMRHDTDTHYESIALKLLGMLGYITAIQSSENIRVEWESPRPHSTPHSNSYTWERGSNVDDYVDMEALQDAF